MLKPRLSVVRPLSICLWLGSIAALVFVGFSGCQGPDTFLRNGGGGGVSGNQGTGGSSFGSGGTSFGAGGRVGSGGSQGSGGSSFGLGGSSGSGGVGVGGRIGSGGSSMGGSTGTGGLTGNGGARDGGADAGTGGAVVFFDASADSEGGVVTGNGPCAAFCAPAIPFSEPPNYGSPQLGTGAACYETVSGVNGGGCSNCTGRTVTINGATQPNDGTNFTIPAKVAGGYCVQVGAGGANFASFYTYQ